MITLMGITLALTVFIISAIPSELSDLSNVVPKARSTSLNSEFIHLKEIFGLAVNQYLINYTFQEELEGGPATNPDMTYRGNKGKYTISYNIQSAIDTITNQMYSIESQYNKVFHTKYSPNFRLFYSHSTPEGNVYLFTTTIILVDEQNYLEEPTTFSLICNEKYFS
jgi:hypothetical protein